jgi:hypothetical protein
VGTIRKILVFGLPGIKEVKFDDSLMSFPIPDFADHLADYDIVIYCTGAFRLKYTKGLLFQNTLATPPSAAIRRGNEIRSALERGRIVCFLGSHKEDYVVSEILKSYCVQSYYIDEGNVLSKIRIRRSEFKPFLDDVGATQIGFAKSGIDEIICSINESHAVGFSKRIGKGLLLSIPCIWGSKDPNYIIDHMQKLVAGLISYSTRIIQEPPEFLSDFQFSNEKLVIDEIRRIEKEKLTPLKEEIRYYDDMKSILWLGDNSLVSAVDEFLRNFGFQTYIDEIREEDLWIVDKDEKLVMIEVKSMNKNLARQDISKLDEHREAREVPNLTALLIANTFMAANSLEAKDQPFPP